MNDGRRLAVITGGSRGLGASLCNLYARRGWEVIEFSRSAPHPYSVRVDLSDPESAARAFADSLGAVAERGFDEIVGFGNAAVLAPVEPVARSAVAGVKAHLDINLVSAVLFSRALMAAFQRHPCRKTFVNITSGAATKAYAGWSLYCASKAALEIFVRSVALEQARQAYPIRVVSVNPGVMDTSMQEVVRGSSAEDFPEVERFLEFQRAGLLRPPADVALAIAEMVRGELEPGGVYTVGRWGADRATGLQAGSGS